MTEGAGVVDTDIHPVVDAQAVARRLPEPWRTRYAGGNRGPGHLGYRNPNGVMRGDTKLPDGRRIEADPAALGTHLLDACGIDVGILNPAGSLQIGLSPDADYAAAVVRALNDVVRDDWLTADPRLRADGGTPDFAARLLPAHLRDAVLRDTARALYRLS